MLPPGRQLQVSVFIAPDMRDHYEKPDVQDHYEKPDTRDRFEKQPDPYKIQK